MELDETEIKKQVWNKNSRAEKRKESIKIEKQGFTNSFKNGENGNYAWIKFDYLMAINDHWPFNGNNPKIKEETFLVSEEIHRV